MWFLREIFSVLYAPWILLFVYPARAERVVQFFVDFTIEVDGLGKLSILHLDLENSTVAQVMFAALPHFYLINTETKRLVDV